MMSDAYEDGVRAGVENMVMYFQDENGYSTLSDFTDQALNEFSEGAIWQALQDRKLYTKA